MKLHTIGMLLLAVAPATMAMLDEFEKAHVIDFWTRVFGEGNSFIRQVEPSGRLQQQILAKYHRDGRFFLGSQGNLLIAPMPQDLIPDHLNILEPSKAYFLALRQRRQAFDDPEVAGIAIMHSNGKTAPQIYDEWIESRQGSNKAFFTTNWQGYFGGLGVQNGVRYYRPQ